MQPLKLIIASLFLLSPLAGRCKIEWLRVGNGLKDPYDLDLDHDVNDEYFHESAKSFKIVFSATKYNTPHDSRTCEAIVEEISEVRTTRVNATCANNMILNEVLVKFKCGLEL